MTILGDSKLEAHFEKEVVIATCPLCETKIIGWLTSRVSVPEEAVAESDASVKAKLEPVGFSVATHTCTRTDTGPKFVAHAGPRVFRRSYDQIAGPNRRRPRDYDGD